MLNKYIQCEVNNDRCEVRHIKKSKEETEIPMEIEKEEQEDKSGCRTPPESSTKVVTNSKKIEEWKKLSKMKQDTEET